MCGWKIHTPEQQSIPHIFFIRMCLKLGDNPKTQGKIPNMFSTMGFKMVMLRPPRFPQPSACDAWAQAVLRQVTGYAARFGFQRAEDPQSNRWWSFPWHWPEIIATDPLERVVWMNTIWKHGKNMNTHRYTKSMQSAWISLARLSHSYLNPWCFNCISCSLHLPIPNHHQSFAEP